MEDRGKLVRLPMKFVEGRWVLEYGGDPPIEQGARGELLVQAHSISESPEKALFLKEERFQILPEGTPLLVVVEVRDPASISEEQANLLIPWEDVRPQRNPVPLSGLSRDLKAIEIRVAGATDRLFARHRIGSGGLWLQTEGMFPVGLISSEIDVPHCISTKPAQSLNHAYTLLSQVFENWRRSHTGSVYRRIFYQESDDSWQPLGLLRDHHVAGQSRRIANGLWKKIIARYAAQMA